MAHGSQASGQVGVLLEIFFMKQRELLSLLLQKQDSVIVGGRKSKSTCVMSGRPIEN